MMADLNGRETHVNVGIFRQELNKNDVYGAVPIPPYASK